MVCISGVYLISVGESSDRFSGNFR